MVGHPRIKLGNPGPMPNVKALLEARAEQGWVRLCVEPPPGGSLDLDLRLQLYLREEASRRDQRRGRKK